MKLSLLIAVQTLAASWNQTLSNATTQWSGESDALLLSDVADSPRSHYKAKSLWNTT